jgi:hypothetical protein
MPSEMDYAVGVLIRQCLILSLFMLISPNEIAIDYLDLLHTENSSAFM